MLRIMAKIYCWPYFSHDESKEAKSFPNPPKMLPRASPNLPKWTPDGIINPLGDYMGTLIGKNLVLEPKKITQEPPGEAKMEWDLKYIWTLFSFFLLTLCWFLEAPNLKKGFSPRRNINFCKTDVFEKSTTNHRLWDLFSRDESWKTSENLKSPISSRWRSRILFNEKSLFP